MKLSLLLLAAMTVSGFAETLEIRDRITPEELTARRKESPMDKMPVLDTKDEKKVVRPTEETSIVKESQILHDGSHWTIVPKGAVLYTPTGLSNRVGSKPVGSLLPWAEFVVLNRAWLSTHEVNFDQAAGKLPLSEESQGSWPKQAKVVIAVFQGGPISVKISSDAEKAPQP